MVNNVPQHVQDTNARNEEIQNERSTKQPSDPTGMETAAASKPSSKAQSEDLDLGRQKGGINRFI